jgi:hypothetical protein
MLSVIIHMPYNWFTNVTPDRQPLSISQALLIHYSGTEGILLPEFT